MYNETIYNVFLHPDIEGKLFKKRNAFNNWLLLAIVYLAILLMVLVLYLTNVIDDIGGVGGFLYFGMIVIMGGMVYILLYNPLRKYHNSLQIYYYMIFLSYFHYSSKKYPVGIMNRLKFFVIVQSCIDSIDRYIKLSENYLISGENTISRIKYLRALRDLMYRSKGKMFFNEHIAEFNEQLNLYISSVHSGLKAVLDFDKDVEYLDNYDYGELLDCCNRLLEINIEGRNSYNKKASTTRSWAVIVALLVAIATPIISYVLFKDQWWAYIGNGVVYVSSIVTIVAFLLPKSVD